jgi:hypothetical protein
LYRQHGALQFFGDNAPMTPEQFIARWHGNPLSGHAGAQAHFDWENKRPGRDLKAALKQFTDYAHQALTPPWPPPKAGRTTRRRCRTRKFCSGCWR